MDINANYFCKSLPKVELHAHLSGSMSKETFNRLLQKYNKEYPSEKIVLPNYGQSRSPEELLSHLRILRKINSSLDSVYASTCDIIRDYADENVKYLELRSVPRQVEGKFSRRQYVEAILAAIDHCIHEGWDIDVKYLVSIDRSDDIAAAQDCLQLARELLFSHHAVAGVDLGGNPSQGDARIFIPLLEEAKRNGLHLAFHAAEFPGRNAETKALLQLDPDRIGQAIYIEKEIGGSLELTQLVENCKIPIEFGLSANLKSGAVPSLSSHPFWHWYSKNHPCILCCDLKGAINTNLSNEYILAARTFQLSSTQIWELSLNAINYIFADDETKARLRTKWRLWQAHEAPSFTSFMEI